MRQVQSDKSNVAWFTLAECVSRGEKERALGVYRLLSHSLDDSAVVAQLEGDILWAFNDKAALEKYYTAADRYQHDGRLREALAVLEHVRVLAPQARVCLQRLIEVVLLMQQNERLVELLREYIVVIDDSDSYAFARAMIDKITSERERLELSLSLVIRASVLASLAHEEVVPLLHAVALASLASHDERLLQRLSVMLEQSNAWYYEELLQFLAQRR